MDPSQAQLDLSKLSDADKKELNQFLNNEAQKSNIQQSEWNALLVLYDGTSNIYVNICRHSVADAGPRLFLPIPKCSISAQHANLWLTAV